LSIGRTLPPPRRPVDRWPVREPTKSWADRHEGGTGRNSPARDPQEALPSTGPGGVNGSERLASGFECFERLLPAVTAPADAARRRTDGSVRRLGLAERKGRASGLARIRFSLVPHTGQVPCAMRRPDSLTFTSPVKSRFSLHFTQYASPV
jgi:hypothetical protein